ncbi:MAG: ferredoxin [Dissulfuribacterales bacterium]
MKVIITKSCMGDRNCNELCPEVFEYDEWAMAISWAIIPPIDTPTMCAARISSASIKPAVSTAISFRRQGADMGR